MVFSQIHNMVFSQIQNMVFSNTQHGILTHMFLSQNASLQTNGSSIIQDFHHYYLQTYKTLALTEWIVLDMQFAHDMNKLTVKLLPCFANPLNK